MRKLLLSCFLVAGAFLVSAQSYLKKENHQWISYGYQGISPGMSFNSNPPLPFAAAQIGWSSFNGTASIADKNGNLLFYADGNIIWDRNNNVMANGWDINNDGSASAGNYLYATGVGAGFIASSANWDGVAITPVPGSSHKYYVFDIVDTLIQSPGMGYMGLSAWEGKLRCSVVDMELNNGLGAVDSSYRSRVIADNMAGNLQVVTGEDCNYWLIGFGASGDYRAFNITSAGIDTIPVISTPVAPLSTTCFELTASPDRRKLAQALGTEVQVCDFDPATGVVSNTVLLGAQNASSAAFSPNNSKLYAGGIIGIRQYDLSAPTWPMTMLMVNNYTGPEYDMPLRLAPDGKIYFIYNGGLDPVTFMTITVGGRIQQPDLAGTACLADTFPNAVPLLRSWFTAQFPNEVAVLTYDTSTVVQDAPLCFDTDRVALQPASLPGTDFHWKMNTGSGYLPVAGDTSVLVATTPGTYTVQYYTAEPCTYHEDTFIVKRVFFSLDLGKDRYHISCDGRPVVLKPDLKDAQFLWQDGSTEDHYEASHSGLYWVEATLNGCSATDSASVLVMDLRQRLGPDTVLCAENKAPFTLRATATAGADVLWNTGSTEPVIQVQDSGLYWVRVTDSTCIGTDSIIIHKEFCDCPLIVPNAFSPNNDGLNDQFLPAFPGNCPISEFKLQIFNRWGQLVFVSYKPAQGWNGIYKGSPADVGTYMYRLQMKAGKSGTDIVKNGDFVLLR